MAKHPMLAPIKPLVELIDGLFLSKEEKIDKALLFERLQQRPTLLQLGINQLEAKQRKMFIAGWRPFIGWICGLNLAYVTFVRDGLVMLVQLLGWDIIVPEGIGQDMTLELIIGMLGLSGLRTYEKRSGVTK